jgi:hypothetical protein
VLLWYARAQLLKLVVPSCWMLLGGGLVYRAMVSPLKQQLRELIAEHNESRTHHANESSVGGRVLCPDPSVCAAVLDWNLPT